MIKNSATKVRKAGSTMETKRVSSNPGSSPLSRSPNNSQQPHAFRKKGSTFKTGFSKSTITAKEQAEAYKGIDKVPEEETE